VRPPARPNRHFFHPLDRILGTEAAVRILRMLSLERTDWNPMEIAARCSLGRPGATRALARLQGTGVVERVRGRHRFPRFRLARHPLATMIADLFDRERRLGRRGGGKHRSPR
jgi:DNA-binding transcriptional ArsR family regulator